MYLYNIMSRRRAYIKHKEKTYLTDKQKNELVKEYNDNKIPVKDLVIKYDISKRTLYNILDKLNNNNKLDNNKEFKYFKIDEENNNKENKNNLDVLSYDETKKFINKILNE